MKVKAYHAILGAAALTVTGLAVALSRQRQTAADDKSGSRSAAIPPESAFADRAVEPLSRDVLLQRIIDIFPISYLTLISIIQGAVFGLLVITAGGKLAGHHGLMMTLTFIAQSATVFTAIVAVTQLYIQLTVLVRWAPAIMDTLILYSIGLGELSMAIAIGSALAWWASLAFLVLMAILAFIRSRKQSTLAIFGGHCDAYRAFQRTLRGQVKISSVLFLLCFLALSLNAFHIWAYWINAIGPWTVIAGGMALSAAGRRNQISVYNEFSMRGSPGAREGKNLR